MCLPVHWYFYAFFISITACNLLLLLRAKQTTDRWIIQKTIGRLPSSRSGVPPFGTKSRNVLRVQLWHMFRPSLSGGHLEHCAPKRWVDCIFLLCEQTYLSVELLKSYSLPFLLYGFIAATLSDANVHVLDSCLDRAVYRIFLRLWQRWCLFIAWVNRVALLLITDVLNLWMACLILVVPRSGMHIVLIA